MAKVISFTIQKGGCGKSLTCGTTAYLLSLDSKVLVIDFDSQGNVTELLTQRDVYDFHTQTVFEAIQSKEPQKYIHKVSDNLDIMTAEDHLALFPRWLYTTHKGNKSLALAEMIAKVESKYDYILIDTPPSLGDHTINALSASDGVVILFEASKFCYSAISRVWETIDIAQKKVNPELKVLGVLCSMVDSIRTDSKEYIELIKEEYPCFNTVIKRRAATGRIPIYGYFNNPELNSAVDQYKPFIEELKQRVHS